MTELSSDIPEITVTEPPKPQVSVALPGLMAGGVTDHGALTGLADDDHPQYLNEARGDARYPSFAYADSPDRNLHDSLQDASVTMDDPDNQAILRVNIEPGVPDPDTSAWPDRFQFRYWGVRTGTFNEYGEVRSDAAKASTVAMRVHGNYAGSNNAIFQVRSRRQDHTTPAPGVASYDIFDVWLNEIKAYKPVLITNDNKLETGLTINRSVASDSVNDADTLSVKYLGNRAFWTNEVGLPRTQIPTGKEAEIPLKVIASSNSFQNDIIQAVNPGSSVIFKVGRYGGITIAPTSTAAEGLKIQMPAGSSNAIHVTRGGTDVFRIGAADKVNIHAGLTMQGSKIEALADPTSATDAANKLYVDSGAYGSWQSVTLNTNVVNTGGSYANVQYRLEPGGVVRLRGSFTDNAPTSNGGTYFWLPSGARPDTVQVFDKRIGSVSRQISVHPDGTVRPTANGTAGDVVHLDGITFVL